MKDSLFSGIFWLVIFGLAAAILFGSLTLVVPFVYDSLADSNATNVETPETDYNITQSVDGDSYTVTVTFTEQKASEQLIVYVNPQDSPPTFVDEKLTTVGENTSVTGLSQNDTVLILVEKENGDTIPVDEVLLGDQ